MKKKIFSYLLITIGIAVVWGCKHDANYEGGEVSAFISNFDLRKMYKGTALTLNSANMKGATAIKGIVVSDHSGGNMPAGLLVVQNIRPVGNLDSLRGMSIAIGADAANYLPGDSVHIKIDGGLLQRQDGILQITGLSSSVVEKKATGRPIAKNRVPSSAILAKPSDYESTLVIIVKAGFDPVPQASDIYQGDKVINDGFDNFTLHTEADATFAKQGGLNFNANYYGIVFNTLHSNGKLLPHVRIRTLKDIKALSSTPEISSAIIAGYMADPEGGDGNYEYMQFLATRDINFAITPFSVVVTSNAGGSSPTTIFPLKGWATGIDALAGTTARTFKFNLTSGTVTKGEYFYVGGSSKLINGPSSTSLATLKWIRSFNYTTTNGDGFGLKNGGLFANSGNASGFAIFEGTQVDVNSAPVDAVFIGENGSIFSASLNAGYRIPNNDFYDKVDVISDELTPQPFFLSGTNTLSFAYQLPANQGFWNMLSGVYDEILGKWVKARTQNDLDLDKATSSEGLERSWIRIGRDANGVEILRDTIPPTKLKSQLR